MYPRSIAHLRSSVPPRLAMVLVPSNVLRSFSLSLSVAAAAAVAAPDVALCLVYLQVISPS